MTVKEVKQAFGDWTIFLRDYTPREIIDKIQANPFGHVAIVPGRVNPAEYGDGLLSMARYVGVFRAFFNQPDGLFELKGTGMAFWLGDEDDKGDVFETPKTFVNETFPNTIRGLLPPSGSITEGTIYSVPGGQLYSGSHRYETSRKAITYVTDTFSTLAQPVEWRVNGDGTLDAGPIANLYRMEPRAIMVEKDAGRELELTGLRASLSNDYDVENYTTRVVLVGEGTGGAVATGTADGPATPYKDIHGNPVKLTQVISESGTSGANANIRAQVELNKKREPRRAAQINTDEYDVKGEFVVGDYIYVFDPDGGFYDINIEETWRGVPINPMKLRVIEMTWPIRANWTVAFRTNSGEWIDLSEYYRPETGSTYVSVGDFLRTLAGNGGTEPISSRPITPDSSIPAAPSFTGLSTGSYQSGETNTTKSAIRAQWNTPLNLDGSTVVDGDHYEIQYRSSHYIGYQVKWGQLSNFSRTVDDNFTRSVINGWGGAWTVDTGFPLADYLTTGDKARHAHTATGQLHGSLIEIGGPDQDITVDLIPYITTAAGAPISYWVTARATDFNNYYAAHINHNSNTFTLSIYKRVGGVLTQIATGVSIGTHNGGVPWRVRVLTQGNKIRALAWRTDGTIATKWIVEATDSSLTSGTKGGVQSRFETGNTNTLPQNVDWDNFVAVKLTASGYKWGELSANKWGAPISAPVSADPKWLTAYVGWGTNEFTILELTPGMTYELQIRAVDTANPPHVGPWSASSFVTTVGDLFPPSVPASPVVASSMIAIQVQHNLGKNSGGTFNLENDLDHLDVHVGGSDSFYPDNTNKVGELIATAGMLQAKIPAVGSFRIQQTSDIWVRVVAVDRAGNKSGASPAVQSSATLIDDAHISDLSVSKLTAGTITAKSVLASELEVGLGGNIKMTEGALHVYDSGGVRQIELGKLRNGAYGMAAIDPTTNALTNIQNFIFGPKSVEVWDPAYAWQLHTNFGDLTTSPDGGGTPGPTDPGPEVTVTIGETGRFLLILSAEINVRENTVSTTAGAGAIMSCEIRRLSNNTVVTSPDFSRSLSLIWSGQLTSNNGDLGINASRVVFGEGYTPGAYKFTAKYRSYQDHGTVWVADWPFFLNRQIVVLPY